MSGFFDQIVDFMMGAPKWFLVLSAGVGVAVVGSKVLNFVRLWLSLFVLPGKNVSFILSYPSWTGFGGLNTEAGCYGMANVK